MSEPVLRIEALSVGLPPGADRALAVDDVTLDIAPGEILCVVGESGSGKSVLASAVMAALPRGLQRARGRITFLGEDLTRFSERRLRALRGRDIAMIFQEPIAALNPAVRVGQQVEEMFAIHTPKMPAELRRQRALELLAATHLPDLPALAERFPHQLSGGQCQRVVIAMALAQDPKLLIADEPTTALDVTTQAQILRLVRELRDSHGHAVLFITHDFGVVADLADRVAVMQAGRLVEIGPAEDVLNRPRAAYTKLLIAAVPKLDPPVRPAVGEAEALRVENLSKRYGAVRALDGVSLEVPTGATVAVVGESGSGKSTLARAIVRLLDPSGGRVVVDGTDMAGLRGHALRTRRRLAQMVFQDPFGSLNPRRAVGDVLTRAGVMGGMRRSEARRHAAELVRQVGLPPEALGRRPAAFSGGQRQRIGIARALAPRPRLVVADESVSALDVSVQAQVLALFDELQRRTGLTLLFITHDLRVAAQVSDRIAVMRSGQIVETGDTAQVLARPTHPYTAALLAAAPGRSWHALAATERQTRQD